MTSLEKILMKNVVEKGSEFTHTSLSGGSYYIQSSSYEPFIRAYIETVERGGRAHLTEKHRDIGPIVI
jgi:phosphomannomutase